LINLLFNLSLQLPKHAFMGCCVQLLAWFLDPKQPLSQADYTAYKPRLERHIKYLKARISYLEPEKRASKSPVDKCCPSLTSQMATTCLYCDACRSTG
jgi:hypothetical protein